MFVPSISCPAAMRSHCQATQEAESTENQMCCLVVPSVNVRVSRSDIYMNMNYI